MCNNGICHVVWFVKKGNDMQWCKLQKKLLIPKFKALCGFM